MAAKCLALYEREVTVISLESVGESDSEGRSAYHEHRPSVEVRNPVSDAKHGVERVEAELRFLVGPRRSSKDRHIAWRDGTPRR